MLQQARAKADHAARAESRLRSLYAMDDSSCPIPSTEKISAARDLIESYRRDAVRTLGVLASKHVDWDRRDEVLFRLSWELWRRGDLADLMGERDRAFNAYGSASRMRRSLENLYPASPWLPLALVDEASRRFKSGETIAALEMYKRALKSPTLTAHLRAFLLYRAAWCYRHKGNAVDSRRLFDTADAIARRHLSEPWSTVIGDAISRERQ